MPDKIQEVLQAFASGELVVVTDDEDREGEGDLIVAASLCTPEKMAFIIRHTSGIVCAPITTDDARRLRLDPMVAHNDSSHTTAFTVSIDYKPDGGTGISAEERASCCRALANPNAGAGDFARPGHIFPLIARDGGVLLRSGHTEAAVDLCKLSGLPPVGVISELMNDDGTVMKGEQVARFAAKHHLKHVTIADMIAYRQAREKRRTQKFVVLPVEAQRSVDALLTALVDAADAHVGRQNVNFVAPGLEATHHVPAGQFVPAQAVRRIHVGQGEDAHRTVRRLEGRFEHVRARQVAPAGLVRHGWLQLERPAAAGVQDPREDRG